MWMSKFLTRFVLRTEAGCFPSPGAITFSCSNSHADGISEIIFILTNGAPNSNNGSYCISSSVDNSILTSVISSKHLRNCG